MPDKIPSPIDIYTAQKIGINFSDADKEALEEYQLQKVRALLSRLRENSLFYREKLRDIIPESILTMDDFRKLPVTTEKDLYEDEYRFQCVSPRIVERIITVPTTGTHGKQKRISFTLSDLKLALDFSYIAFTTFCKEGDRLIVFMSGNTAGGVGDSIKRSLEPLKAETYVYGPVKNIPDAFEFMSSYAPDIIVGIPCQIAALAEYGRIKGSDFTVRNVLLSSDDVPDSICRRLENIWGCETFRHFGMTETCLMGGCECACHSGYHMRNADHLFEIIDPDERGFGELAVTTFSHEAMPLLRYKTGDIARISSKACGCGSRLPRIENVKGRLSNSFPSGRKRVFLRDIEEVIFSFPGVTDFECSLSDRTLKIELRCLPDGLIDIASVKKDLIELTEDDILFEISSSESLEFNYGYNAKKTL